MRRWLPRPLRRQAIRCQYTEIKIIKSAGIHMAKPQPFMEIEDVAIVQTQLYASIRKLEDRLFQQAFHENVTIVLRFFDHSLFSNGNVHL